MTDSTSTIPQSSSPIPPDDPERDLARARADEEGGRSHISIAGDTYTVLLAGRDTAGRFTLIDMHVPPGGGPPPHRHDFEETFTVLEGEIEVTFRGTPTVIRAGDTVNVPANAPHAFRNASDRAARMLCICAPAGQEEFFAALGDAVPGRTSPPPPLDEATIAERRAKALELAPRYRSEFLVP